MKSDWDAIRLDLKLLQDRGRNEGWPLRICWRIDGTTSLELMALIAGETLVLSRFVGPLGSPRLKLFQKVGLTSRACRFGGTRKYLQCPRPGCARNAMRLVLADGAFVCRHCASLRYSSKSISRLRRLDRRLDRLADVLGSSRGDLEVIERPKGMWQRTFERRIARLVATQAEIHAAHRTFMANLGLARGSAAGAR